MQLSIFASLALLCSSVIAAPPQRREASVLKTRQTLAEVGIDVSNVLNDLNVTVARALIGVDVNVTGVLDDATIKVLSTRDSEEKRQSIPPDDIALTDPLEDLDVTVARALIGVDVDVTDVLDDATIKVLSTRDSEEKRQILGLIPDITDVLDDATVQVLRP